MKVSNDMDQPQVVSQGSAAIAQSVLSYVLHALTTRVIDEGGFPRAQCPVRSWVHHPPMRLV